MFLKEIEKSMQVKLMSHLEHGANPPSEQSSQNEEILQRIVSDSNVSFYWVTTFKMMIEDLNY